MNYNPKEEQEVKDIPENFWETINSTEIDNDKFKAALLKMSKEEMVAFYQYYKSAAFNLTTAEHLDHMPDNEDDVQDITNWAVAQGKNYFLKVYHRPEELPLDVSHLPGLGFASLIIRVFGDTFNEDIWRASVESK